MKVFSNLIKEFIDMYLISTPAAQRVMKVLQRYCKHFRAAFPSVKKIAQDAKCSESTVKRVTRKFQLMGFLHKIRRGYCSNVYCLADELAALNLDSRQIHEKEQQKTPERTNVDPVSVPKEQINISTSPSLPLSRVSAYAKQGEQPNKPIPEFIKLKALTPAQQQKLANNFSEHELVTAIESGKWYNEQGKKVENIMNFLWVAAETLGFTRPRRKIYCR